MKKLLLFLFAVSLVFTSCTKPPDTMGEDRFMELLRNGQIDKVKVINETQVEFTIKNSKEYPMAKWYQIPPIINSGAFVQMVADNQRNFEPQKRAVVTNETRITFLREVFNYLLPIIVLTGLVIGFLTLRRNRS
jgi:hypothetical protein